MTVYCMDNTGKEYLAKDYESGKYTLRDLASMYGISTRTVGRVLKEFQLDGPTLRAQQEKDKIMDYLRSAGLDKLDKIKQVVNAPVLSADNVQAFLNRCNQAQLAGLFYKSALVKVVEAHNHKVAEQKEQQEKAQLDGST